MIFTGQDTILSQNKLKKIFFLNFLLKSITILYSTQNHQKNILLNSPFHFKTVKSHTNIPTISYQIILQKPQHLKIKILGNITTTTIHNQTYIKI